MAACTTFPPDSSESRGAEDYTGRWIGKWDNTWCVQFTITQDQATKNIDVLYEWEEKPGQPLQRAQIRGQLASGQLKIGNLIELSISARSPDEAIAYGRFPTPRTAALARNTAQRCGAGKFANV
jgi:hypothetical protein